MVLVLPVMDEHGVIVASAREAVWQSVVQYGRGLTLSRHRLLGAVLGAEPRPGFEISHQIEGERLELSGRHRFSLDSCVAQSCLGATQRTASSA